MNSPTMILAHFITIKKQKRKDSDPFMTTYMIDLTEFALFFPP